VILAAYGVARDFAETAWPRRTASPGPQSRKGLIQLRQVNYESNCNSARVDALVFANGSAATSKLVRSIR
jgi:hypothetical protein